MDKPTYEQVQNYAKKRRFISDPGEFFNHYQHNGWTKDGQPVYNWRALFQGWEREEKKKRAASEERSVQEPKTLPADDTTPEELAEIIADIERLQAINQKQIDDYRPELLRKAGLDK